MGQEEFRTVRYVTQGPIQNLRVRVTLTRLSALRGNKAGKAQQAQAQPRVRGAGCCILRACCVGVKGSWKLPVQIQPSYKGLGHACAS